MALCHTDFYMSSNGICTAPMGYQVSLMLTNFQVLPMTLPTRESQ